MYHYYYHYWPCFMLLSEFSGWKRCVLESTLFQSALLPSRQQAYPNITASSPHYKIKCVIKRFCCDVWETLQCFNQDWWPVHPLAEETASWVHQRSETTKVILSMQLLLSISNKTGYWLCIGVPGESEFPFAAKTFFSCIFCAKIWLKIGFKSPCNLLKSSTFSVPNFNYMYF